jgi:hypothetical protein
MVEINNEETWTGLGVLLAQQLQDPWFNPWFHKKRERDLGIGSSKISFTLIFFFFNSKAGLC